MRLLLLLLFVASALASPLADESVEIFNEVSNTLVRHGDRQLLGLADNDMKVAEPFMAFNMSRLPVIRPSAFDSGFYARVSIQVDAAEPKGFRVLQLRSFTVKLRDGFRPCLKCNEIQVGSLWTREDGPSVVVSSEDKEAIRKLLTSLHFKTPEEDVVRKAFEFRFRARIGDRPFILVKQGLPVRRLKHLRDAFWFETGRVLLFTIRAKIGHDVFSAFSLPLKTPIPADGSLPDLFRSGHLDRMRTLATESGMRHVVFEMRKQGRMVAQATFDVVKNSETLDASNWFSRDRLVSTQPFDIPTNQFNFFSVAGNIESKEAKRRFFINYRYNGCNEDAGFVTVIDKRGVCNFEHRFWNGKAPALLYTATADGNWNRDVREADRLLIYLE